MKIEAGTVSATRTRMRTEVPGGSFSYHSRVAHPVAPEQGSKARARQGY